MFDIGWSELLVIGIVALIAIGPKELPGALRALGHWTTKIRRMASEFQGQFQEAMREAEMTDLKKQVDTLTSGFDPIETARKDIESAMEDKPASSPAQQAGESWEGAGSPESPPTANEASAETAAGTDVAALNDAPVTAPGSAWEPAGSEADKSIDADRPSDLKPEAGRSA
jgi:sec-independent protein translocase protein TatB